MNTQKIIMELCTKSQMQQTLYDVLKQLDEWKYDGNEVEAVKTLLRTEARKLGKEIESIQTELAGGELK